MTREPSPADLAKAVRFLAMDTIEHQNFGHPGSALGAADEATVLFTRFLKFDPADPAWPDRDRFVLSVGHASALLYALLHLAGYAAMDRDQLEKFRCLESRTPGHPELNIAAGVEMTTGPLGQGFASAVGMAFAERLLNARFGDGVVDHYTYVLAGDGCIMEGVTHESVSVAGHYGLGRLIVLWDDNRVINDGAADTATSDDYLARYAASGWHVQHVDGHDHEALAAALTLARKRTDTPSLIRCTTTIGYGAPTKTGDPSTHGTPLGAEEMVHMREVHDWPFPPFEIPNHLVSAWREPGIRGAEARAVWQARFEALPKEMQAEFKRTMAGDLPKDWQAPLLAFKRRMAEERPTAPQIGNSGNVLEVLAAAVPELVTATADLEKPVAARPDSMKPVRRGDFGGRYIQFGIREHALGCSASGFALHGGLRMVAGTYLVFAGYMWPAIRQAALMEIPAVFLFGDDSIGVGTNGPTHQPVEVLAGLRAVPNLHVYRPADAIEAAECWALALERRDAPSALAFARQPVPTVRTAHVDENLSARGAYVLVEASGKRQATLLATGSEVSLAVAARETLEKAGIAAAVVSMPCWERFEDQDADYQASVLGEGPVRVAIEAGVRMGWDRWIGPEGIFIGMTSFGASAPGPVLFEHFGITADAVVAEVKKRAGG